MENHHLEVLHQVLVRQHQQLPEALLPGKRQAPALAVQEGQEGLQ